MIRILTLVAVVLVVLASAPALHTHAVTSTARFIEPLPGNWYPREYGIDNSGLRLVRDHKLIDRAAGTATPLGDSSTFPMSISGNGRYAYLRSGAGLAGDPVDNVFTLYLYDSQDSSYRRIGDGWEHGDISDDGRYTAFITPYPLLAGDTNACPPFNVGSEPVNICHDVYLYDSALDVITRVSLGSAGEQPNNKTTWVSISGDGNVIAWASEANNLVPGDTNNVQDIFLYDRAASSLTRVTNSFGGQLDGASSTPELSYDGRFLSFDSLASGLAPSQYGGRNVFVLDRQSGTFEVVSIGAGGQTANAASEYADISDDGRFVTFLSAASNLVSGDAEGKGDAFLRDRQLGATIRVSQRVDATGGNGSTYPLINPAPPAISGNGSTVIFTSDAKNLTSSGSAGAFLWGCDAEDSDGDCIPDVYESNHSCVDGGLDDANADPDGDSLTTVAEYAGEDAFPSSGDETDPCDADTDGDGHGDLRSIRHVAVNDDPATDNCPLVANATQQNTDAVADLGSSRPFDDVTNPNSDALGDACDPDDENDGLPDATEMSGCMIYDFAHGVYIPYPTDPLDTDTDGDAFPDGWECSNNTVPTNPAVWRVYPLPDAQYNKDNDSLWLPTDADDNDPDFDGDGLLDGIELFALGTDPLKIDSDGDGCSDGIERATVNVDRVVNSLDLSLTAQSFGLHTTSRYALALDSNQDRNISAIDLSFIAQRFGQSCPAP